tara:strand:+ start:1847 stop:2089 length:243 start_codon:yes stop_codon:yes gene_type:complete
MSTNNDLERMRTIIKDRMKNSRDMDYMTVGHKVVTWDVYEEMFNLHNVKDKNYFNGSADQVVDSLHLNEVKSIYDTYMEV